MAQRGRKSAAQLEVVSPIRAISRPKPLESLTDEQSAEWVAIVNRLPADWFPRETHGLLAQYCKHVISARRVAELIERHIRGDLESSDWVETYDRLLKMQEREGRAMSSLATRMRISQQATASHKKGKGGSKSPPPHMQ